MKQEHDLIETRKFWSNRHKEYVDSSLGTLTLFSDNQHYIDYMCNAGLWHLTNILKTKNKPKVLDLGCGPGREDILISPFCSHILAVDYSQGLIDIAKDEQKKAGISNIDFQTEDITKLNIKDKFDVIIIAGTLLYLTDSQIHTLLQAIQYNISPDGILYSRESTAMKTRISRRNEFDQKFNCLYNATYRTTEEFINIFNSYGFKILTSHFLVSPLNLGLSLYDRIRYKSRLQWLLKTSFYLQNFFDTAIYHDHLSFANYAMAKYKKFQKVYLYGKG